MADNLQFPILFDLEKGVEAAIKEWDGKYADKLEKAIQKRALNVKLKFDTTQLDSLDAVKTRLAQLKIEPITPETKSAIKELASELRTLAKALEQVQKYAKNPTKGAIDASKVQLNEQRAKAQAALAAQRAAKAEDNLAAARLKAARAANVGTSATRNANKAFAEQSSYLSRLIQRMAAYWSIRQVGNFLTNIREVTAQFELQRISLGAIIQDQARANQLFSEIKSFALKSPVSILDLTKYTKQLAAYKVGWNGVTTDVKELFDWTKRLTDVSVGIGTSMDRVVLAFGQVRATGYLRASEVRQFTEMGIPIVEELAAKLSKLNGEAVTAADVMDMISERGISFEMVKDVFDDMTSAGGMFYNMQEKQGNTLYGLWAKLGDAASVMYEQIGNTGIVNKGMKAGIQALTDLMRNWQQASRMIAFAGAATLVYITRQKILKLETAKVAAIQETYNARMARTHILLSSSSRLTRAHGFALGVQARMLKMASTAAAAFGTSLTAIKSAIISTGWGALILALGYVADKLLFAKTNAERAAEAISKISEETATETAKSVRNFEYLANKAVNAPKGSKEQKEALEELNRTYSDILPKELLELEYLDKLNGKYGSLTNTIREYIAEQQRRKALDEITNVYGAEKQKYEREITNYLREQGWTEGEIARFWEKFYDVAKDKSKGLEQVVTESVISAGRDGFEDVLKLLQHQSWQSKVDKYTYNKIGLATFGGWLGGGIDNIDLLRDVVLEENQAIEQSIERHKAAATTTNEFADAQERAAQKIKKVRFVDFKGEAIDSDTYIGKQALKNFELKELTKILKDGFTKAELTWDQECGNFIAHINEKTPQLVTTINFDILSDKITKALDNEQLSEAKRNYLENLFDFVQQSKQRYDELVPSNPTVAAFQNKLAEIATAAGANLNDLSQYFMQSGEKIEDYAKRIGDAIKDLELRVQEMQQVNEMHRNGTGWALQGYSEQQIEKIQILVAALKAFFPLLQGFTKTSGGGTKSDPRLQNLKEEISLYEKLYQEYQQYEKAVGSSKAVEYMNREAKETIDALAGKYGIGLPKSAKDLTSALEILYKKMEALPPKIFKNLDKELKEFKWKIEKVDIDASQKSIEAELKRLSDRISRTKTAKEFYEKILRLTRNEGLAFQATFSVYGKDTLDTFTDEVEQLKQNFGKIDITAAINLKTKQIDYKALREIWEADKALPDNLRKIPQDYDSAIKSILDAGDKLSERQRERWGKDLERAREYADKRIELAQYTATQIAEIEAKRDSLDPKSENYAAQVAMYDKMISGYREREKNKAAKLDYEQIKEQIGMFDDLGVRIGTAFESILTQLREYTKSPDFARLGLEAQKNVYQQIAKIEDRMAEGFQGIGIGTVSEYVRQYSTAASEYLIAQNNLRDATLKAIEADKEWERVKNSNNEAAKSAALADKTLADSRVQTAAASVNVAGANLQRAQEGAARASAKFDSNLQKVESSLKSLNNGALKALWDLIGDKGKRSVGEFLSGSRKILSALDKLTKALADSGSDMGKLSTTIATNLATALQNINPDDTEAIAKAATDSLKTTLSSVISDKGVVDLLANTLSKNIGEIASQALSGVLSTEDAAKKVGALIDGVADAASKTGEMWGAIISLILSLLDEFAENGIGTFLGELLDNIADAVAGILANLLTDSLPKILGSVGNVVKGVGTGLADMLTFGVFDITGAKRRKKANKEIKSQQKLLDQLEYTYGRLEKAADKVFGHEYLNNYNQQLKILQAQQQAYLKQAEAERSKGKKKDEDKIKEYENQARDTADKIMELQDDLVSQIVGTDVASAARDFANAWLDAYLSFGSTTDAIKEKFDDMIKNMIVNMVLAQVVKRALQPIFDMIDELAKDGELSTADISKVMSRVPQTMNDINNGLTVGMEGLKAAGFDISAMRDRSSEFSGIAKNVAGATSEEINNVAAIGNTLMYYVSPIPRMDENLARIRAIMENGAAATATTSAASTGWTDWQQQAMDNYTAIQRNTADTVVECRRAANACEKFAKAIVQKGATAGLNVFLKN